MSSHNLANVNTTGFKKARAEFQDLMSLGFRAAGAPSDNTGVVPTSGQVGLGTRVAAVQRLFSQGDFQYTGNPLDLAIEGRVLPGAAAGRLTLDESKLADALQGPFDEARRVLEAAGAKLRDLADGLVKTGRPVWLAVDALNNRIRTYDQQIGR